MQADSPWLYVVPWGLRKLLCWIHQRYNGPDIYILENGVDCPNESALSLPGKHSFPMYVYQVSQQNSTSTCSCSCIVSSSNML